MIRVIVARLARRSKDLGVALWNHGTVFDIAVAVLCRPSPFPFPLVGLNDMIEACVPISL